MTTELESELRAEIDRLREINQELGNAQDVQVLRLEVTPKAGGGVRIMATCSIGEEFGPMALQMVAMAAAQLGGIVTSSGVTPAPAEPVS